MKVLALAAVVAAFMIAPASAQTATSDNAVRLAQADINVRIGESGVRVGPRRDRHHHRRHYYRHRADCRTVVVKERRGNTVITKRINRC